MIENVNVPSATVNASRRGAAARGNEPENLRRMSRAEARFSSVMLSARQFGYNINSYGWEREGTDLDQYLYLTSIL